ncbi:hypothetical protein KI387_023912, partial [Taxus chinensis]
MRTNNVTISSPGLCVPNVNLKRKHVPRSIGKGFNLDLRGPPVPSKQSPLAWQQEVSRVYKGLDLAFSPSRGHRDVVANVIPFEREEWSNPPPDLASYFLSKRIIYLGWPLFSSVFELILQELLYLQDLECNEPAYLYINSTGSTKNGIKLASESQAISLHDFMRMSQFPIYTLCVGHAWGEAALLLAAGAKGYRAALPSASIMMKQPITMARGQATDIDIARDEITFTKGLIVQLLAKYTGHSEEKILRDIRQPKYFSPLEAVEYGLIDK